MKKVILALVFLSFIAVTPIFAHEEDEKKAAESIRNKIEFRLEKLREKIASEAVRKGKVATKTAALPSSQHHIKGVITQISEDSFQLQTPKLSVTILTDTNTKYFSVGGGPKQAVSFSDLRVNDRVSVVGIGKKDLEGLARLVVRHPKQKLAKKRAVFGTLTSIDGNNLIITHIRRADTTWQIEITSETRIKKIGGSSLTIADLKVGDRLVAVGTVDDAGVITAKFLFISPGKFKGIPFSTPSAAGI